MTINPKIAEHKAEIARLEKQVEQLQHRNQRRQNLITYYEKGDRQKRAHRLITRGAAIESIVPQVKDMSERDFYQMMEKILCHPSIIPLLPKGRDVS